MFPVHHLMDTPIHHKGRKKYPSPKENLTLPKELKVQFSIKGFLQIYFLYFDRILSFKLEIKVNINSMKVGGPSYLLWTIENFEEFCELAEKLSKTEVY